MDVQYLLETSPCSCATSLQHTIKALDIRTLLILMKVCAREKITKLTPSASLRVKHQQARHWQ
jgi:uncharacterized lipoprotein YajG